MLVAAGADVNYIETNDGFQVPMLINAIYKKNAGMVKLLLDKGANPNCERLFQDGRRFSALRDSIVEWPDDEIARMLVAAGADVNYIETNNGFQVPMLINAIYQKNPGMVRLLLDKGADPNCERRFQDGRRFSALRDSIIQWPNNEIARMLINAGADVDYSETAEKAKVPVLTSAICEKKPDMVRLLLDKGANPNCERIFHDGRRFSALRDSIIQWPSDEIAWMLINAGADVNYIDTNDGVKVPVLISAICEKNAGVVKLLLDKGANPNCERVFQNGHRYSALRDSIAEWPSDEIAKMLIASGADVNYIDIGDKVKIPVLIHAISNKKPGLVKLLLEKGANPNCERVLEDGQRTCALRDSILQWPNEEIARMLVAAGARFEKDEQLRRAKLENTHFSKETFRRFRAAGWRPPLF